MTARAIPPPCSPDIFKNGTLVMMTHTIGSQEMEAWVKKVAAQSEQSIDWHFAGGRACVLALGDLSRVRTAISELMSEHDALQSAAVEEMWKDVPGGRGRPFVPSCVVYGTNEWNPVHEFARQSVIEERAAEDAERPSE